MALPSLEELTTPLTPDDVKQSIYGVLAAVGVKTTTWKPGAVVRTIIAGVAVVVAALSQLMADIARSGFLELAEGPWLSLVAHYVFGVDRIDATFAAGTVTLNNGGGGVFPMGIGDVVFKNTTTGKTYRNTSAFTLNALQVGLDVPIAAVEAGADSSAGTGDIDGFETPMIGVTVTNANPVVGLDAESDPSLRTRCLEKRSALSPNGPRDAYAFFAKSAVRQDGTSVGVTRVRVSRSSTNGQVTVTVASPTGAVPGLANNPTTDLGAVDVAIKQNVVPDGITETTQSASALTIPVTYEIWTDSSINLSDAQITDAITARLVSFMTTQPIGGNVIGSDPGKVFVDAIRTTIGATRSEFFHVIVSAPAADVVLAATDVPMLGAVTSTAVHRVSQ